MSDVVISGVPGEKFKVPTELIRDGAVCVNFSSERNFDGPAVKEKASIYVPMIGKVTIAVLLRNLLVCFLPPSSRKPLRTKTPANSPQAPRTKPSRPPRSNGSRSRSYKSRSLRRRDSSLVFHHYHYQLPLEEEEGKMFNMKQTNRSTKELVDGYKKSTKYGIGRERGRVRVNRFPFFIQCNLPEIKEEAL